MARLRADASKWGDDVTMVHDLDSVHRTIDTAKRYGGVSWTHLLVKEVAEAVHEVVLLRDHGGSTKKLEAKLLKVSDLAMKWVKALRKRQQKA